MRNITPETTIRKLRDKAAAATLDAEYARSYLVYDLDAARRRRLERAAEHLERKADRLFAESDLAEAEDHLNRMVVWLTTPLAFRIGGIK